MAGLLLLGDLFRDRNKNIDGKQAHTVLVVARQVLEKGNYFFDHGFAVHFLDELGQVLTYHCLVLHRTPFESAPYTRLSCQVQLPETDPFLRTRDLSHIRRSDTSFFV